MPLSYVLTNNTMEDILSSIIMYRILSDISNVNHLFHYVIFLLEIHMHFKAIIFDLDGTLLDTLEDIGDSLNRTLEKFGFPVHTLDTYRYLVGDGVPVLVERALPETKRNDKNIRACTQEFKEDYRRNWNVKTRQYDGIDEMLDSLKAHGMKMAVLSNKPEYYTKRCVTELLPDWNFDIVLGQRDDVPQKPDPAGAIEITGYMKILPEEFLYLGDTAVDMNTATAANMFAVGALWGFRSKEELLENGAKVVIEKPQDIMGLLNDI